MIPDPSPESDSMPPLDASDADSSTPARDAGERRRLLAFPKLALVVLMGPSGSGKSTFARQHFLTTEVLSSDYCRGLVSDDENNQAATNDAFEILHHIAAKRLARGLLTVIDATNVQAEARAPLVALARKYHCLPVAIVLNTSEEVCHERNGGRADRSFKPHVVRQQRQQLRRSLRTLQREGFRQVFVLERPAEVDSVVIERTPLWNDRRDERGPFDIIGDVHGCCDELEQLLAQLGYQPRVLESSDAVWGNVAYAHPEGRKAVFVGDLVDRGPRVLDTVRLVRNMVQAGSALCVPGNHDVKLVKKLRGGDVRVTHGLAETLAEIDALDAQTRAALVPQFIQFLDGLISHYVLDHGRLVVAHAGLKEEMHGRASSRVRDFALYGETTGETDEFGLPVRLNWANDYRGSAMVVYGHTPVPAPEWLNQTLNVDTGCVFGGQLSALRYPEREVVSVPARRVYCQPARPFLPPSDQRSAQQRQDDLLDAADVRGKRILATRLQSSVILREENTSAALEVMSRFAANPKWLIYLPPTMSPCETSGLDGWLEHPAQAFAYYREQGLMRVVCQEKHMGSRAVVVVCRDEQAARERFGIAEAECGIVYTRTGRRFFTTPELEREFLDRLRQSLGATDFWSRFETTWACLDCELMPWSAKAQDLLRSQYAAVGAAGRAALPRVNQALAAASQRLAGNAALESAAARFAERERHIEQFVAAYRQYCWPVKSLDDLQLAPFHLLATEGHVHVDRDHEWQMRTLAEWCAADPRLLRATSCLSLDLADPASEAQGVEWWERLTAGGGEGMVVKPLEFIARSPRGLAQPAVKCRGREYLRIIYGPDYTVESNLTRLKRRGLGAKRSLALREFALGVESLERFVRGEPLRRVHECVFGVLALESEPVDPRL